MDEFYQSLLKVFVLQWLSQFHLEKGNKEDIYYIHENNKEGHIQFFTGDLIELKITNEEDDLLFYLHYELHDFKNTFMQLKLFIEELQNTTTIQHQKLHNTSIRAILVCCSGGLSSGYFAFCMQDILDQEEIPIRVDARSYTELTKYEHGYDRILLAPQIRYLYGEFRQKYGDKVSVIDTLSYARQDFHSILEATLI